MTPHTTSASCKNEAHEAEIVRLRNMLGRYAAHVASCEGTDFLEDWYMSLGEFILTEAEMKEISRYSAHARGLI